MYRLKLQKNSKGNPAEVIYQALYAVLSNGHTSSSSHVSGTGGSPGITADTATAVTAPAASVSLRTTVIKIMKWIALACLAYIVTTIILITVILYYFDSSDDV